MRSIVSLALAFALVVFVAAPAVAQDGPRSSVSVGVGDATDITITAPLFNDVSLLVTSTRQSLADEQVTVSRVAGGVRYGRRLHERVGVNAGLQFGSWFGDGVVNPRAVWRDVDFRFGGKVYVTDSWGFSASAGYRQIGDDFEIQNLIQRPSETPWGIGIFGEF